MTRFKVIEIEDSAGHDTQHVVIESDSGFTSFPASVGNPVYDSFLESQSLTDAEVQAMEPDVWHEMA